MRHEHKLLGDKILGIWGTQNLGELRGNDVGIYALKDEQKFSKRSR